MSTISNELLKDLRMAFSVWQQDYDPVEDKAQYDMFGLGIVAMDELLALRKERETEESAVCQKCGNTGLADSGGVQPWGEPILIECDCTAPPAPDIADDSLPYDRQIAEYEQMMEAEQAQADTTSQQFESLAGKAVGGWIPCSERMPEVGEIVLTADNGCVNVGEMERSGSNYRYFTSVVSGRELPATHWQPLPEPPCK
ncbi:DUF551 domain-containing protein [Cronobacter sakazakii]|uniref:DUF551 domain-containing protein n=1 Tax=Cronobacter sakazakii TaxID=28141 RepID=UPI0004955B41|nr:DUF551 domain-containing protein [Cronobacter sakazakii]MDK1308290.1 DUF551 domain-containing protein [Cronobacter sakazakii]